MGKKWDTTEVKSNEVVDLLLSSVTNAKDIANCFNNHFTTLALNLASQLPQPPVNPETYLTKAGVRFKLKLIDSSKVFEKKTNSFRHRESYRCS